MSKRRERPVIEIEPTTLDRFMEAFGLMGVILLIGIPAFYYSQLPEMIPQHFGADGIPDRYGNKEMIWTLPIVGLIIFVLLYFFARYPQYHKYVVRINEENALRQYRLASMQTRILNTMLAITFCYITYSTIQTALGNQHGLGTGFIIVFNIAIFGTLGFFMIKSYQEK